MKTSDKKHLNEFKKENILSTYVYTYISVTFCEKTLNKRGSSIIRFVRQDPLVECGISFKSTLNIACREESHNTFLSLI